MKYFVKNRKGRECGHKHRTEEAAHRCAEKLEGWTKDGKRCSAEWYGCYIVCVCEKTEAEKEEEWRWEEERLKKEFAGEEETIRKERESW